VRCITVQVTFVRGFRFLPGGVVVSALLPGAESCAAAALARVRNASEGVRFGSFTLDGSMIHCEVRLICASRMGPAVGGFAGRA
jgi:hypothetical protein